MFATRADLLARSNASRLAQLAIPADREMVDDAAIRLAITGGDLSGYSAIDAESIALALLAIDDALADAGALMVGYGIPDTAQSTLLARMESTIAMYYLQGTERMCEDIDKAYQSVIKTLESHSKGVINLVPVVPTVTDPLLMSPGDSAEIIANPSRYDESYGSGWWA
jgi:phage gp36-like protein